MPATRALAATLALLAAAALNPAAANSIDGHWCTEAGLRLTITGPNIVTPGGARMQGEYGRHDFAYTAPPGDPGSGARVVMRLRGENLMDVQAPGLDPVWRRCGPPTS